MKKLIPLAQVEQLIDEMMNQRENALHSIWNDKYLQDSRTRINWEKRTLERLKSKLSSLPTEESGWIAVDNQEFEPKEMIKHLIWYHDWIWIAAMDSWVWYDDFLNTPFWITHYMPLPKPPLQ